jgi:uncharacterized NAD(P)/FAD-binding protein YdhS
MDKPAVEAHCRAISIVGGGCSGLLTAVQLLRHGFCEPITIIEPRAQLGRGLAYSTTFDDHLLNVPAGKMSGLPDEPSHFLDWLTAKQWPGTAPGLFAPRRLYGEYLGELLEKHGGRDRVQHVRAEVNFVERAPGGAKLHLNDGTVLDACRVVLALGNPASGPALRAPTTELQDRWHLSPWIGDVLRLRAPGERILLVGAGLTAVDAVLALQSQPGGCTTYLLSRTGKLPQVHSSKPIATGLPPLGDRRNLRTMFRALRVQIGTARDQDICWRAVIDALRPVSNQMWRDLPLSERERFLRHLRTYWETHRHRMAPAVRARLDEYRNAGRVEVIAGRLRETVPAEKGIEVRIGLRHGSERRLHVDRVINCTGIHEYYNHRPRRLIGALIEAGIATANDLGIGFHTDEHGALIGADGIPSDVFFTLGPPRRGELFETTAVPEIRTQAAALARHLIAPDQHDTVFAPAISSHLFS